MCAFMEFKIRNYILLFVVALVSSRFPEHEIQLCGKSGLNYLFSIVLLVKFVYIQQQNKILDLSVADVTLYDVTLYVTLYTLYVCSVEEYLGENTTHTHAKKV